MAERKKEIFSSGRPPIRIRLSEYDDIYGLALDDTRTVIVEPGEIK